MILTKIQKKRIRLAIDENRFNPRIELKRLINEGFESEEATRTLKAELAIIQEEIEKNKENDVKRNIAFIIVIVIGLMGGTLKMTSIYWYLFAIIATVLIAFWGHRDKPIAGIVSCICLVILMPLASTWYFGERENYVAIEIFIPTLIAGIPCYFLYEMLDKAYYDIPY